LRLRARHFQGPGDVSTGCTQHFTGRRPREPQTGLSAVPHTFTPGETQWSIAAANGISPAARAAANSHEYGTAVDLADPAMANVIEPIGGAYGRAKTEAPGEWWEVNYVTLGGNEQGTQLPHPGGHLDLAHLHP
jgi:hypothetical protein